MSRRSSRRARAYGYVAVRLLKLAFEGANTAKPRQAAEFARLFVTIEGPLGKNDFQGRRDLRNLPIVFQRLGFQDGQHIIRLTNPAPSPLRP